MKVTGPTIEFSMQEVRDILGRYCLSNYCPEMIELFTIDDASAVATHERLEIRFQPTGQYKVKGLGIWCVMIDTAQLPLGRQPGELASQ